MISRKINWIPSIDNSNSNLITELENKLANFYSNNKHYYGDIDFTANNWIDDAQEGYKRIIKEAQDAKKICEFGCGNANILKHYPNLQDKYTGCDFSVELINRNKQLYPSAQFIQFTKANELPFENESFDLVFSVFVLEHSTNPAVLLSECKRILKKKGKLVILCPDFLSFGRLPSQRAGFSAGNSKQKIKKKKYADAIVTLFDNRIKKPLYCWLLQHKIGNAYAFYINLNPTVFEDEFSPDVDAVYVTYRKEIINFLRKDFSLTENNSSEKMYEKKERLILLNFQKK